MSKVKAFIEFLPPSEGGINYTQSELPLAHEISNPTRLDTPHVGGIRPFILGVSKLGSQADGGDGHIYWGEVDEWNGEEQVGGKVNWFMSDQRADINGTLNPPLRFVIKGTDIEHFTIYFDGVTREWATLINVDGIDYTNDDSVFVWSGIKANTHTIQIKKYSRPNYQVRVLGITVGLTLEYADESLNRVVASSRNTFDSSKPATGVISQYGAVDLNDTDDNISELNQLGILKDQLPVRIYFNPPDQLASETQSEYFTRITEYQVGEYITQSIKYQHGSNNVGFSLGDSITEWEGIWFEGFNVDEKNTAEELLHALQRTTPVSVRISQFDQARLRNFELPDGYLSPSSLQAAWNSFCEITDTRIVKNIKGEIWLTLN